MRSRRIAVQIRARLGESISTIREHSTPLEKATTSSLEALKAYSAARNAVYTRGFAAAIPHLQRAIAIDPQFAMAHADLGFFYWNMGQTDLGAEYVRKAYELRDRVSDRERLFILFLYDRQVTGNLQKELETLESWAQTYPGDFLPWGLLGGWGTRGTGHYERGIEAAEEALRLNPDLSPAYGNLVDHNLGLGRLAEAEAALQRAAERKLENPLFLISRYYLAFLKGDEAGMKREIERAHGNLEAEGWMSHNQALVLARSGQMRNARILWRHTIEQAQQTGHREKAAIYQAAEAVCEAHFGNRDQAKEDARAALALGKGAMWCMPRRSRWRWPATFPDRNVSPKTWPNASRRTPRCNSSICPRCARFSRSPRGSVGRDRSATNRASLRPSDAGHGLFREVRRTLSRLCARSGVLGGRAGPGSGGGIPKSPGPSRHRPCRSDRRAGAPAIGESARLVGESDRATSAYQDFLAIWKDADSDIPLLKQARAEYGKL